MATAQTTKKQQSEQPSKTETPNLDKAVEATIKYVPIGQDKEIELSISRAMKFIAKPTKSGAMPDVATVVNFLMICQARKLNPYVGDVFLTGYDSKDGPQFATITAYQAISKRAEMHPEYDGIESGIIVDVDGVCERRTGTFRRPHESLVGAWCKVYRKDRQRPTEITINRKPYDKGFSMWSVNPDWMLVKCAAAAAKREAFPLELSELYLAEEIIGDKEVLDRTIDETEKQTRARAAAASNSVTTADLTRKPEGKEVAAKEASELSLELSRCLTIDDVNAIRDQRSKSCSDIDEFDLLNLACDKRIRVIESSAPVVQTVGADGQLFETTENAAEA